MKLYPVKTIPALKDYIWGGTKLSTFYHKTSEMQRIAETWELSCHPNGQSVAANGPLAGKTLPQVISAWGRQCLGKSAASERFPILIKLIDAAADLSIQVHPDDAYAKKNEGESGKTEMWYIVDAEPGARLVYGFNRDLTRDQYRELIQTERLTEALNFVPVKKGDTFFIKAGMVHAIGAGLLIAEIQQNSDTTYRVYDYGRLGADGQPRPLHVDKAIEVSELSASVLPEADNPVVKLNGYTKQTLVECPYFNTYRLEGDNMLLNSGEDTFSSLVFIQGEGRITAGDSSIGFKAGDTFFIPAGLGDYNVLGQCSMLLVKP